MSDAVLVALMVGVISPALVSLLAAWQLGRTRKQEWARQDAVADRLLAAQEVAAKKAQDAAEATAKNEAQIAEQLTTIHTLVNSDMTAARESELHQTRLALTMTEKVIALDEAAGRKASTRDLDAVQKAEARMAELEKIIADRLEAQGIVNGADDD